MFSIATHGHVNPSLGIIQELARRGHRVTYAIPPAFADLVTAAGAEPRVYRSLLPGSDDDLSAWGRELVDYVELFLDDGIQALPQLIDAYEGENAYEGESGGNGDRPGGLPDVVLADTACFPGRVLAHRWGVPHIQLSAHMAPWVGYEEEAGALSRAELTSTPRGVACYERFTRWLTDNGIALHPDDFARSPERSLVLIPEALQPHADRVDRSVYTFVGGCQGDRGHQGEWVRPEGAEGKRVLLISLGSAFTNEPGFYRSCLEAFGGLPGWHVVLQVGKHVDAAELGPVPVNFEVHGWVPQLSVLRQADAFITHAGAGGSQEGLATGTPMIAVPQAVDQFGNAEVLEGLGVARHVPKGKASAEALREAFDALLGDPAVAARCAEVSAWTAAEGGAVRAADLIEAELPEEASERAGLRQHA